MSEQPSAIVAKARRFLEHEAVRSATTEHKRHFLERKGLSAQQIDEAMRPKANASDGNPASVPPSLSVSQQSPAEAPVEAQQSPAEGQRSNYGLVAIARGAPLLLGCVVGAAMTAVAMAATRRWHESDTAAAPVQSSGTRTSPSRSPRTDAALRALRNLDTARSSPPRRPASPTPPPTVAPHLARALTAALAHLHQQCTADETAGDLPRGLQTLLMLLNNQICRPTDPRYHRLNSQNANLRHLLMLPGAADVLATLGFVDGGESFWVWCGCSPAPETADGDVRTADTGVQPAADPGLASASTSPPCSQVANTTSSSTGSPSGRVPREDELEAIKFFKALVVHNIELCKLKLIS